MSNVNSLSSVFQQDSTNVSSKEETDTKITMNGMSVSSYDCSQSKKLKVKVDDEVSPGKIESSIQSRLENVQIRLPSPSVISVDNAADYGEEELLANSLGGKKDKHFFYSKTNSPEKISEWNNKFNRIFCLLKDDVADVDLLKSELNNLDEQEIKSLCGVRPMNLYVSTKLLAGFHKGSMNIIGLAACLLPGFHKGSTNIIELAAYASADTGKVFFDTLFKRLDAKDLEVALRDYNEEGYTLMHYACHVMGKEQVEWLGNKIDHGSMASMIAELKIRCDDNDYGFTPFAVAFAHDVERGIYFDLFNIVKRYETDLAINLVVDTIQSDISSIDNFKLLSEMEKIIVDLLSSVRKSKLRGVIKALVKELFFYTDGDNDLEEVRKSKKLIETFLAFTGLSNDERDQLIANPDKADDSLVMHAASYNLEFAGYLRSKITNRKIKNMVSLYNVNKLDESFLIMDVKKMKTDGIGYIEWCNNQLCDSDMSCEEKDRFAGEFFKCFVGESDLSTAAHYLNKIESLELKFKLLVNKTRRVESSFLEKALSASERNVQMSINQLFGENKEDIDKWIKPYFAEYLSVLFGAKNNEAFKKYQDLLSSMPGFLFLIMDGVDEGKSLLQKICNVNNENNCEVAEMVAKKICDQLSRQPLIDFMAKALNHAILNENIVQVFMLFNLLETMGIENSELFKDWPVREIKNGKAPLDIVLAKINDNQILKSKFRGVSKREEINNELKLCKELLEIFLKTIGSQKVKTFFLSSAGGDKRYFICNKDIIYLALSGSGGLSDVINDLIIEKNEDGNLLHIWFQEENLSEICATCLSESFEWLCINKPDELKNMLEFKSGRDNLTPVEKIVELRKKVSKLSKAGVRAKKIIEIMISKGMYQYGSS